MYSSLATSINTINTKTDYQKCTWGLDTKIENLFYQGVPKVARSTKVVIMTIQLSVADCDLSKYSR